MAGRHSLKPVSSQSRLVLPERGCSDTMLFSLRSRDVADCAVSDASALVLVNEPPKDCKDGLIRYICCQKGHAFSLHSCMCLFCVLLILSCTAFQSILEILRLDHCNMLY